MSQVSQKKIVKKSHDVAPTLSQQNNDDRINKLLSAVERLEGIVSKQSEQIASLLKLENKPVKQESEKSAPDNLTTPSKASGNYLDDIPVFLSKK